MIIDALNITVLILDYIPLWTGVSRETQKTTTDKTGQIQLLSSVWYPPTNSAILPLLYLTYQVMSAWREFFSSVVLLIIEQYQMID